MDCSSEEVASRYPAHSDKLLFFGPIGQKLLAQKSKTFHVSSLMASLRGKEIDF